FSCGPSHTMTGNRDASATATAERHSGGQVAGAPSGWLAQSKPAKYAPTSPPSATAAAKSAGSASIPGVCASLASATTAYALPVHRDSLGAAGGRSASHNAIAESPLHIPATRVEPTAESAHSL